MSRVTALGFKVVDSIDYYSRMQELNESVLGCRHTEGGDQRYLAPISLVSLGRNQAGRWGCCRAGPGSRTGGPVKPMEDLGLRMLLDSYPQSPSRPVSPMSSKRRTVWSSW